MNSRNIVVRLAGSVYRGIVIKGRAITASALVAVLLIALFSTGSLAHLGRPHPFVWVPSGLGTYWTAHGDWHRPEDEACGGKYTLLVGNQLTGSSGNSLTFHDIRLRASHLSKNNPEAAGSFIKSTYNGSAVYGAIYDWRWSGWSNAYTWIIPTGSTYIYQTFSFQTPATQSYPAYAHVYHEPGDGSEFSPPGGSGCTNYDVVNYYR